MITYIVIAFISTLILSLAFTPVAKKVASLIGAVDLPNNRKVHTQPTTRLGGVAIAFSLIISLGLFIWLKPELFSIIVSDSEKAFLLPDQALLILGSLLLVLSVGIWDDVKTLSPGPKFFVQLVAATLIFLAGFNITVVANPFGPGMFDLMFLSYPITIVWIIGVTNAFNLIDGLDGLASGVAAIALGTIASIAYVQGQFGITLSSILLAGAIFGFLWYNFRPATIFLGDSGSLFLGFVLALLSIESYTKISTTFAIFVPIFALGLPIIDTLLSMVRRFFSWFIPNNRHRQEKVSFHKILNSIFQPDKSHIHHQLINHGFSHRNTVLVLYVVSLLFGIGAFAVAVTGQTGTTFFIILMIAAVIKAGISRLRYKEIDFLHNGIFYAFYNSLVVNKRHFRKILDSLFIVLAYTGSVYILAPEELYSLSGSRINMLVVPGVPFIIQFGAFLCTGLYRETIRRLGIADVFKIIKSIFSATLLTGIAHHFFFSGLLSFSYLLYILDFYFLVTFILGIRVSFHLLRYLFNKSRTDNRRVLIYGAGEQGLLALQRMMNLNSNQYTPVGFLDENPVLEGRLVNGFTVFGGHWKLKRLVETKNIEELHIACSNLSEEVFKRIYKIAQENDLQIQFLDVRLRNLNHYIPTANTNNDKLKYAN